MSAGAGSKVDDIWLFVSMALLDVILGHVCSTTSSTDFRYSVPGVLGWDMHPSGDLFFFARTHRKRRHPFVGMVETMPPHRVRYISRS